jgi:hypothetical protein
VAKQGVCKLTGEQGKFVNAHLLPKALTKAGGLGVPMTQSGRGMRPETRHSSWYDNQLVTAKGEKVLADLDDWAIKELRRLRLVWSGWGPMVGLSDVRKVPNTPWGWRTIEGGDWRRLRLFFLSLLWRAAASQRFEFNEVEVSADDLERLRIMVLNGDPDPVDYFQIQLVQLSTRGIEHNHTPLADTKRIGEEMDDGYDIPFFRFYFDGLIAHFDRREIAEIQKRPLAELALGAGDPLTVTTVTFEESFQRKNFDAMFADYVAYKAALEK